MGFCRWSWPCSTTAAPDFGSTPALRGRGTSSSPWRASAFRACCGWRSSSFGREQPESVRENPMALEVTQVHRNLHQRVTWLYLEIEDMFLILGLGVLANFIGRFLGRE